MLLAVARAQSPQPRESLHTVLAIQYVGIQDAPIFPIIISDSKDGAEWYRTAVLKKIEMSFADVHVVDAPLMSKLIKETELYGDTAHMSPEPNRADPNRVSITLVKGGKRSALQFNIQSAIFLLDKLKKVPGGDASLHADIEHFQERIRPMSPTEIEIFPTRR